MLISIAIGGVIGFYVAKHFLQKDFRQSSQPGAQELVDELDKLSDSILATGESNADIINLLLADGQSRTAKLLHDTTRDLVLSVIYKDYQLAHSQGLLDSLDIPARHIYERNEKAGRILESLDRISQELENPS